MFDVEYPTSHARPMLTQEIEELHPRCLEMAEAMRDLFAAAGGVRSRDLIGAGFTWGEIVEFRDAAAQRAIAASVRQVHRRPDMVPDLVAKACAPMPDRPPLPRDTSETHALLLAWGRYCTARAALLLDPWAGQRERCLAVLGSYLDRLPIFPAIRQAVILKVETSLPEVSQ